MMETTKSVFNKGIGKVNTLLEYSELKGAPARLLSRIFYYDELGKVVFVTGKNYLNIRVFDASSGRLLEEKDDFPFETIFHSGAAKFKRNNLLVVSENGKLIELTISDSIKVRSVRNLSDAYSISPVSEDLLIVFSHGQRRIFLVRYSDLKKVDFFNTTTKKKYSKWIPSIKYRQCGYINTFDDEWDGYQVKLMKYKNRRLTLEKEFYSVTRHMRSCHIDDYSDDVSSITVYRRKKDGNEILICGSEFGLINFYDTRYSKSLPIIELTNEQSKWSSFMNKFISTFSLHKTISLYTGGSMGGRQGTKLFLYDHSMNKTRKQPIDGLSIPEDVMRRNASGLEILSFSRSTVKFILGCGTKAYLMSIKYSDEFDSQEEDEEERVLFLKTIMSLEETQNDDFGYETQEIRFGMGSMITEMNVLRFLLSM